MEFPPLPSRIGKKGAVTDIDGNRRSFTILDEVRQIQSTYPGKVICLEKLQFDDDDDVELRLGYYIIGKKPGMAGKWVWGQFSTMMPIADFRAVVSKAIERGWI